MKIKKILVANRGEVALRIIRTCQQMGIKTVALCPKKGDEHNFLETKLADEYYSLGEEGAKGYLDGKRIIEIAKKAGVDAIHPGYGFLSESWKFARLCHRNRIKFIGPDYRTLKKLEDKIEAKKIAKKVGIPVLPSSRDSIKTKSSLVRWIRKINTPFILKARKGGGGIGLKAINGEIEVENLYSVYLNLERQMGAAFAETDFFLEKYLPEARHIEFQILGDGENVVHLGERECTIQRRNQKLFEEAPSTFLTDEEREKVGRLAVKLMKSLKYKGAGTVEFLFDKNRNFYFIEANPRLQVEHPVTESITNIDIVEQQIRIAEEEPLPFSQEDISFHGWAVEARITAESLEGKFRPQTGVIGEYLPPGGQGIFLHSFCHQGQEILPYFDPLIAKVIAWGKNREEAISRLARALDEYIIEGIPTTIPFFKALLKEEDFLKGNFTTNFIEKKDILSKIARSKRRKRTMEEKPMIKEKDIANFVFEIYKHLRKEIALKKENLSYWKVAERVRMLRQELRHF